MPKNGYAAIKKFLESYPLGIFSTLHETKGPWGSAMYFYADGDDEKTARLYCLTRTSARKYKQAKKDPRVSMTFVDEATVATLQMTGIFMPVKNKEDQRKYFDLLNIIINEHVDGWAPVHKLKGGHEEVIMIKPTYARLSTFRTGEPTKLEMKFTS